MRVTTENITENPSGKVIELFLAKLVTLPILYKGLKNPIQLINPLSDSFCKDFALC